MWGGMHTLDVGSRSQWNISCVAPLSSILAATRPPAFRSWYDATRNVPLWPFGHGHSYTTFSYSGVTVTGAVSPTTNATVTMTLTNTGKVAGAEVVQICE